MTTLQEKQHELNLAQTDLDNVRDELADFEKSEYIDESGYDETLDIEGPVQVCGMDFNPSRILKNLDETAYRCGFNDYVDAFDIDSIPEYVELTERETELEDTIDTLECEIEDLEDEDNDDE